jgi:hypothetical protein
LAIVTIATERPFLSGRRATLFRALLNIGGPLMLVGLLGSNVLNVEQAAAFQRTQRDAEDCVVNYQTASDACLGIFYPAPDTVRLRASYLAENRLTAFRNIGADRESGDIFPPSQPFDAAGLIPANGATLASIDWCQVMVSRPHSQPVVIPPASPIFIGGWAIDQAAGGPARGVVVDIDGQTRFLASYGFAGQDVAGRYGDPPYERSRFRAVVPAGTLSPGVHTLTIRVLAADGLHYYSHPQQVRFEIR